MSYICNQNSHCTLLLGVKKRPKLDASLEATCGSVSGEPGREFKIVPCKGLSAAVAALHSNEKNQRLICVFCFALLFRGNLSGYPCTAMTGRFATLIY
jgi:hypothetical protein